MRTKAKTTIQVTGHHPDPKAIQELHQALEQLADGNYIVSVSKVKKIRSLDQNKYYWFIMEAMADHFGYDTKEEVHHWLRQRFLPQESTPISPKSQSTTELGTKEFTDYIDKIRRLSADYGLPIPLPDEPHFLDFYQNYAI